MASETTPDSAVATHSEEALPFASLEEPQFARVRSGPRISSAHSQPKVYYGPVTIREFRCPNLDAKLCSNLTLTGNYLAGSAKKALRKSRVKGAPEYGDIFMKLPVELQLSVIEHLHPIDLYHFSQTSKSFRSLVLDPKAYGVWKMAFEFHPQLPKPPSGVLESRWAFMLYGPGICGICGKYGALTDFGFMKNFCEVCMRDNYMSIGTFRDASGASIPMNHDVWKVLPKSYRYNGLRYTAAYATLASAKFLREDFDPMWKKLSLIQILVDNGVPRLQELVQEYVDALTEHVSNLQEHTQKANSWATDVYRQFSAEYDAMYRNLTERTTRQMQNIGHNLEDINYVSYSIQTLLRAGGVPRVTTKVYRERRPKIEKIITARKEVRIRQERHLLLERIYADYVKTLGPSTWQYLPQASSVREMDEFKPFLNAPFDKRGDLAPGEAVSYFPEFLRKWTEQQMEEIVDVLPTVEGVVETFQTKFKKLELAVTVLTCTDCKYKCQAGRVLVGWENICRHKRSIMPGHADPCATYEVNDAAVAAAASVVSCVGLDPATTTGKEMDARDDRFMCGNCMPETRGSIRGLKAYTWTECIQHAVLMHINNDLVHSTPAWLLLTPEATRFVREQEAPYPSPTRVIWRCNHCAEHYEKQVNESAAKKHAKKVHCKSDPVRGEDYAPDLRLYIRRRKIFGLGMDPAFEHRCLECAEMKIYKLWEKEALMAHLRTKHGIQEPVEGQSWSTVKIIAAAAASAPTPGPTTPSTDANT